jgi:hypothetical protein
MSQKTATFKLIFNLYVIQEKSINHHDKLGNHSNPILQPLLEQQQGRRLKKLWPADLMVEEDSLTGGDLITTQ